MAAVTDIGQADIELYENIFKKPSIEAMLETLTSWQFERFVGYVFMCAGYTVEHKGSHHFPYGPGVDFNLYANPGSKKPMARIEVRQYNPANKLNFSDVAAFAGVLNMNDNVPGYLVTTSDFNNNAILGAKEAKVDVRLMNGEQFVRYVRYIGGSRVHQVDGTQRTMGLTPPDLLLGQNPQQRDSLHQPVLAVANNKGGVAKTTTALNLALALAEKGKRVLLVDMDGQATLTATLPLPKAPRGVPQPEREHYITEYFTNKTTRLHELVAPTRHKNVWLLASHNELHRLDVGGSAQPNAELAFVQAIHDPGLCAPDGQGFDWIILDTPPAQSFFTRLALAASHYVLLPVNVEVFAVVGLKQIIATAKTMQAFVGNGVHIIGCLRTRWKRTQISTKWLETLKQELGIEGGIYLFPREIPLDGRVEQSNHAVVGGENRTLLGHYISPAGAAYAATATTLLEEVAKHVSKSRY